MNIKEYIQERIQYINERFKIEDEHIKEDIYRIEELQAVLSKIEEIENNK